MRKLSLKEETLKYFLSHLKELKAFSISLKLSSKQYLHMKMFYLKYFSYPERKQNNLNSGGKFQMQMQQRDLKWEKI
jgi:hypothetical protein